MTATASTRAAAVPAADEATVGGPGAGRRSRSAASRLRGLLPPVVLGVVLLVAWEVWVIEADIKPYLLPKPSSIADEFQRLQVNIRNASWVTGGNALIGLVTGTVVGVAAALVSSRFRFFRDLVTPVAASLNAIPLIAVTPILNTAIGGIDQTPRRLVVSLVVFFPIFVNTLKGLTQVDPTHAELLRSYAASSTDVVRKVRIPNALPYLFTGLKVAASVAVISSVVAEYFGGTQDGLGYFICNNAAQTRTPQAWAYVTASCILGLGFFLIAVALERIATPWRAQRQAAA